MQKNTETSNSFTAETARRDTCGLDIEKIRSDFPMLQTKFNGRQLIYLDSAASSQKPQIVIDRLVDYYSNEYGKPDEEHEASKITTELKEKVREKTAKFLNAPSSKQIVFIKGCTDGINMIAHGFADTMLEKDDEVIITQFEHHANIVPWHMVAQRIGIKLIVAPFDENHELNMEALAGLISDKTKLISVMHSSHVLGTILPVKEICTLAHKKNVPVMVDGAQAAPHMPVDVQDIDCEFYIFSGHKMGSPTGVGVLYGKKEWLEKLAPSAGGGDMSKTVTFEKTEYKGVPEKFEGGTGSFADIIAFGDLIDYAQDLDMEKTSDYEIKLMDYTIEKLNEIEGLKVYGNAKEKEPVISFDIKGVDVKDLEKYLNDKWSIAVRAGDLTAQPLMKLLGVEKLLRISYTYYNTYDEADTVVEAIKSFMKLNS